MTGIPTDTAARSPRLALAWVFALVSSACAAGGPPIDECTYGRYYADCCVADAEACMNGDGETRLGCDPNTGMCRLFAGGVVAGGYVASDCPPDELCCLPIGIGGWPFGGWAPSGEVLEQAQNDIGLFLQDRVSRAAPLGVPVTLDYDGSGPPGGGAVVEGVPSCPIPGLCGAQSLRITRFGQSVMFVLIPRVMGVSQSFEVEVWPDASGDLRARFFAHVGLSSDAPLTATCGARGGYWLEMVGTMRLNPDAMADPENAHGVLDADLLAPGVPLGHFRWTF